MSPAQLRFGWMLSAALTLTALSLPGLTTMASAETPEELAKQRAPKPKEFGSVFSYGYGHNHMPKDDAQFDALVKTIKAGGFNIIHTTYSEPRLQSCKKHGVQLMVDLLSHQDGHVYKGEENIAKARAICEKLRGNPDVWGYNIWNDVINKTYPGRIRDINSVRTWDPTHPAYSGGYMTRGLNHMTNADILGYYDFHWSRGLPKHLGHAQTLLGITRGCNANWYTWFAAAPGGDGEQNLRRSMWSTNTGIACGLRGILWFLAASEKVEKVDGVDKVVGFNPVLLDPEKLEWTPAGKDIVKIHEEIIGPLGTEIMAVPLPSAVYGSNVKKTTDNQPLPDGKESLPAPGTTPVPTDFWLQPTSGDIIMGISTDAEGRGPVFVANYNAYAPQQVSLKVGKPLKASLFNRKQKAWQPLEVKGGAVSFPLEAGGGELIRFE